MLVPRLGDLGERSPPPIEEDDLEDTLVRLRPTLEKALEHSRVRSDEGDKGRGKSVILDEGGRVIRCDGRSSSIGVRP